MEKPPKLSDYDGKWDPDEYIQLVDDRMSYFSADDVSKCKLFAVTLVRPTQFWFNGLPDGCIDSWMEFRKIFFMQFTTRKRRLVTEVALSGVM